MHRKKKVVTIATDPVWRAKVDALRVGVMRTIKDIRGGYVNEDDMDKLNNFCLFSLALMQAEGPKKWELAKINAEILSFIKEPQ